MPVLRFLSWQLLRLILVVAGVAVLNFTLVHLAPGDPVSVLAGESGAADAQFVAQLRREFGLDQPLAVQLWHYLASIARLDLGMSYRQRVPVLDLILGALPATLLLTVPAFLLALGGGIAWGLHAAQRRGGPRVAVFTAGTALFNAAPVFWIALLAVLLFSVTLGWLPAFGMRETDAPDSALLAALDVLRHAVLPVATLALFYMAVYARVMRASALEVQHLDHVRTARAKGVPRARVVRRHVAPNAILPVIALAGLQAGQLIGGSVVVETVFAWPGMGRLAFDSLLQRDYPVLMGILLLSSVLVVAFNALTDLVAALADPRIGGGA
ncbi:ABC transporter permease [Roseomonas sp. OT10]|uniref:ABC transporter permease n=1 Tax=Roseomonas cutis TaxID=2897332 RepID=UPI001E54C7B0|nr:ABC transporter permease [Roseomonas sp. OT10]UFN48931.1 ABC transporter permease [Roseomonas sp. OT10]